MFANALRTQSRLRVLTATHAALPATRSISSLVAFRTAVSFSASRSFTTSQVARNEDASRAAPIDTPSDTISAANNKSKDVASRNLPSSTIFVRNIPDNATEEDIALVFAEFGKIADIRIHTCRDTRHRRIAHIYFASKDSVVATLAYKTISMAGHDLRIEYSRGNGPNTYIGPNSSLYYLGCSDESEIKTIFQQFSDSIIKISRLKNHPMTNRQSPAGIIRFKSIETATAALNSLGSTQTSDGEQLLLSYARPRRRRRSN